MPVKNIQHNRAGAGCGEVVRRLQARRDSRSAAGSGGKGAEEKYVRGGGSLA